MAFDSVHIFWLIHVLNINNAQNYNSLSFLTKKVSNFYNTIIYFQTFGPYTCGNYWHYRTRHTFFKKNHEECLRRKMIL